MTHWLIASIVCLSLAEAAQSPQTVVVGWWHDVPASAPLHRTVDLTLRVRASAAAPDVAVEILVSKGVEIVRGNAQWMGALSKEQWLDLPVSVRFVADGRWTLGASFANRRPKSPQVSGTVLTIVAKDGVAMLSAERSPYSQP